VVNKSHPQSLLSAATQKLIVNKRRFSNSLKHEVLLIGDSHLRGCAAYMKNFLSHHFEVLGYVKPGAPSKFVWESVRSEVKKLTMDDILIVCSGSNYANSNDLSKVFHDVISFVRSLNHTNVILVNITYRYDLVNSNVNIDIKFFNRKLGKLTKFFPHVNVIKVDSNRQQFTTHGLHFSHLPLHIYSTLKRDTGSTIALAWLGTSDNQGSVTNDIILGKLTSIPCLAEDSSAGCPVNGSICIGNTRISEARTSMRVRKAPVTKRFFMVNPSSVLISNPVTSCNGLNYLNSVGPSEQSSHLQTGKFNSLSSKEPPKKSPKVALRIYHQNIQGLRCKTDNKLPAS
jgi:hypothetical protein